MKCMIFKLAKRLFQWMYHAVKSLYPIVIALGLLIVVIMVILNSLLIQDIGPEYDYEYDNMILPPAIEHELKKDSATLLAMTDFEFMKGTQNSSQFCLPDVKKIDGVSDARKKSRKKSSSIVLRNKLLLILVTSTWDKYDWRELVRNTWGSLTYYNGWNIKVVFLLGDPMDSYATPYFNEGKRKRDLVIGNFPDTGIDSTVYKHMMGYKWMLKNCLKATYILKTNDHTFVDTFQVIDTLSSGLFKRKKMFTCFKMYGTLVNRNVNSDHYVSKESYPYRHFPVHCSPTAILLSVPLAQKLYIWSRSVRYFWKEGTFVSGILRQAIGAQINDINTRFSPLTENLKKWAIEGILETSEKFGNLPPLFIVFQVEDQFVSWVTDLWKSSEKVHSAIFYVETKKRPLGY